MNINQELITNKQTLSFDDLGNMECNKVLFSVTRGMASREQKQACYQQYIVESCDGDPVLNKKYFNQKNNFELWGDNKLIGLCQNTSMIRDWLQFAKYGHERPEEEDKETLFLYCILEAVFILKKYRGKKLGRYFARVIREAQLINLFGFLAQLEVNRIKHVSAYFYCEYETKGGERFHLELCEDFNGDYIKRTVKHLGYSYEGSRARDLFS